MDKIKFCDLNHLLVEKVKDLGIESVQNDYFNESVDTERAVLITASNPHFSFGGGIDAKFAEYFPYYCRMKQLKGGGNERIGNICFCVTVDKTFKATKEIVKEAIQFALDNTYEGETLLLSGVGTGIGGLDIETFVSILKEIKRN